MRREVADAVGHAEAEVDAEPAAAAQHLFVSGVRAGRVAGRRNIVVTTIMPVIDPFPDVVRHIQHAVGTSPCRVTAHLRGIAHAVVKVRQGTVRALVAPREGLNHGAASGLFPFGFGWQAFPGPGAVGIRLVPVHVDHRVIGVSWVIVVRRPGVGCVV